MTDETQVDVPVAGDATATATAVAEPAPEAPAPVQAPDSAGAGAVTQAAPGKPKRAMGGAGQVVGVIGLVLSLLLAVGSVAGTMWLTGQVNAVAQAANDKIAEQAPKLDKLSETVTGIKTQVDELATAAQQVASSASPSGPIVTTLRDKLDALAARYQQLRSAYTDLRSKIATALGGLQALDRLVPGISVPQGPVDALNNLDAKLQELDGTITGVLSTDFNGEKLQQAASVVAEQVGKLSAGLDKVNGFIADASAKLQQVQVDIANAASQLTTVITIGGIVLALLFLYGALLHWVLFRTSRAAARPA